MWKMWSEVDLNLWGEVIQQQRIGTQNTTDREVCKLPRRMGSRWHGYWPWESAPRVRSSGLKTPCSEVEVRLRFEITYRLHLRGRRVNQERSKQTGLFGGLWKQDTVAFPVWFSIEYLCPQLKTSEKWISKVLRNLILVKHMVLYASLDASLQVGLIVDSSG
jgi:hypothetical protein